jgi:hypothetical protein
MYYDMESLTKIATDAQLNVELNKMGPRTSKAVIKAFNKGYLTSVRGEGALYHSLLADQVKLPIMQFSKKGKWWDTLYLKNIDTRCIPQLSEWWQADRVMFRLENPEQWNNYTSKNSSGRYSHWRGKELCEEPNWEEEIKTEKQFSVGIFGGKELEMFDLIAKVYTSTDEYKEKKEKLIHMIEAQETIKVNYVF